MADLHCSSCGHRNQIGSNFCSSCGAILIEADDAEHTTITFHPTEPTDPVEGLVEGLVRPAVDRGQLAPGGAVLVVEEGPIAGSQFALGSGTTTAGRHPDSDIFLDDVTVSRRHAEIDAGAEGFRVRDVGSLNGTYLNQERIEEAPLADGDELQIGKFKLIAVLAEQA